MHPANLTLPRGAGHAVTSKNQSQDFCSHPMERGGRGVARAGGCVSKGSPTKTRAMISAAIQWNGVGGVSRAPEVVCRRGVGAAPRRWPRTPAVTNKNRPAVLAGHRSGAQPARMKQPRCPSEHSLGGSRGAVPAPSVAKNRRVTRKSDGARARSRLRHGPSTCPARTLSARLSRRAARWLAGHALGRADILGASVVVLGRDF